MQHAPIIAAGTTAPTLLSDGPPRGAEMVTRAVSHRYAATQPPVLSGLDLHIEKGETIALIGRSGSGKSTLLHVLAGLICPTDGVVRMDGALVTGPAPSRVLMFQSPSLFPWMTVAQNAGLGLRYAGVSDPARIAEVLDLVDLADFADRNVQDLSGGQQQRVALARSLATKPAVLLLDEPFSALDIFTRQALQTDVRRIAKATGVTLVLVTHDVSEAVLVADRAILLQAEPGRIAEDTPITVADSDRASLSGSYTEEVARLTDLYTRIAGQTSPTDRREP